MCYQMIDIGKKQEGGVRKQEVSMQLQLCKIASLKHPILLLRANLNKFLAGDANLLLLIDQNALTMPNSVTNRF